MDQVLITTNGHHLSTYLDFAREKAVGLELQAFSDPGVLSGDWLSLLAEYKNLLADFSLPIGIHGAFYDMTSASFDPAILEITNYRYHQNLRVAAELDASYLVFHLNYLGLLKLPNYRPEWHKRQVDFWKTFAQEADAVGVNILIENSWEDDPSIITQILQEVNSPRVKACLDIAHASLYSVQSPDLWIKSLNSFIYCCHLNNHDGLTDLHLPLGKGVIDYPPILDALRKLSPPPLLCLELPTKACLEQSFTFLDLVDKTPA